MKIAILGGGLMGQAIAQRLLSENWSVSLYNRTLEKISHLATLGADTTDNPDTALLNADVVLITLTDADAINTVLDRVSPNLFQDKVIVQMSTITSEESIVIGSSCSQLAADYLECPVLGSQPEALEGKLILMAAGQEALFHKVLPLLKTLGSNPHYIGPLGYAASLKLAMNQLIAGLTSSFALSLALVEAQGIDSEQFMEILRNSALFAPTFDKKLERMQNRDFKNPNFPTKHLLKDTHLFLQVAEHYRLDTSSLEGIEELLDRTCDLGLAEADYSALFAAISPDRK